MSTITIDTFAPAVGTYEIDAVASKIEFDTKHLFGLGKVSGTFALLEGEVIVGDSITGSSVTAVADVASFQTDNPKRDEHVRSAKFLHADEHPTIIFRSSSFGPADGAVKLAGVLVVKGVPEPVELTVTDFANTGDGFTATAEGVVDRYHHHITAAKGMASRWLAIKVTIAAKATK